MGDFGNNILLLIAGLTFLGGIIAAAARGPILNIKDNTEAIEDLRTAELDRLKEARATAESALERAVRDAEIRGQRYAEIEANTRGLRDLAGQFQREVGLVTGKIETQIAGLDGRLQTEIRTLFTPLKEEVAEHQRVLTKIAEQVARLEVKA